MQKLGPVPPPAQIIKLSGKICGSGGFIGWCGRLRGGAERVLDGAWVRSNFKASYLQKVTSAGGAFFHIPMDRAPLWALECAPV